MPARIANTAACALAKAVTFVVGRDTRGHWVVVEADGRGGGLFRNRNDAIHYAEFESGRRPGAVRVTRRPLTLRF